MPTPAISLRLKRFRRRFGISAPRVVVRTAFPRQLLILFAVVLLLILAGVGWFFKSSGFGENERLLELRDQLHLQQMELNLLRSTMGTGQNEASMERAARQQLISRLQELEAENAGLKEDMLIFERLIPVVGQESSVRVESFRVVAEASGRYRYRLLLAFQSAQRGESFRGLYQIAVKFELDGSVQQKVISDPRGGVEIRHFLRREGAIDLPLGAKLISVEARLLQDGKLVAKQEAGL